MTLIAVALFCFELLATAHAVRPTPSPSPTEGPTATPVPTPSGEDRNSGNSAAERIDALNINTTRRENTAIGSQALFINADGIDNMATGCQWLLNNTTGNVNTANGAIVCLSNTAGALNTAIGDGALSSNTTGNYNTADPGGIPQFGLIAENVAEMNPQQVVQDKDRKLTIVRYEQINAMLLNELVKEHKQVEEQQVTIRELKKDLGVLTAQVNEQAAEIQKVSVQVEMRRPLTRLARSYP
jgi:hypothetical protein